MGIDGESFLCGVSCFAARPVGSQRHFDVAASRVGSKDGHLGPSMLDYSDRVRLLKQRQIRVHPQPATDFSALHVRAHHIPRSRGPLPKLTRDHREERFAGADVVNNEPSGGPKMAELPRLIPVKQNEADVDDAVDHTSSVGTGISALRRQIPTKLAGQNEHPSDMSIAEQLFSDDPGVGDSIPTSGDVVINMSEIKEKKKRHKCTFIPVLHGMRVTPVSQEIGDVGTDNDSTHPSFLDAAQIADVNRKLRADAATRLLRAAVENLQRLENRPRDTLRILAALKAQRRLVGRRRSSTLEAIPEVDHASRVVKKAVDDHSERPSINMLSQSVDELASFTDTTVDDVDRSVYNGFGSRGSVSENRKSKSHSSYSYDQNSRTSSRFTFGRSKQEAAPFGSSGLFKTNRLQMHANRKLKQRNVKYHN